MKNWEFKGDKVEGISSIKEYPQGVDIKLRVWFDDDDLKFECPIFYPFVDESIHKEGPNILITKLADGHLFCSSTFTTGENRYTSVSIGEYEIREVFRHRKAEVHLQSTFRKGMIHLIPSPTMEFLRDGESEKTFQNPLELSEYWKRVFLYTHRRRSIKR